MRFERRRSSMTAPWRSSAALLLPCLVAVGCSGAISADKALDQALQSAGNQRAAVARFAGNVTVDGKPPGGETQPGVMVVILYDPKNPPTAAKPPMHAVCDPDGNFEFNTYDKGDGVPVGSYVVLFAQLQHVVFRNAGFFGPDALKNLYNDPEKSEFKVDVSPPGKTDYTFELSVEGKEKAAPGPHAITQIKS